MSKYNMKLDKDQIKTLLSFVQANNLCYDKTVFKSDYSV